MANHNAARKAAYMERAKRRRLYTQSSRNQHRREKRYFGLGGIQCNAKESVRKASLSASGEPEAESGQVDDDDGEDHDEFDLADMGDSFVMLCKVVL